MGFHSNHSVPTPMTSQHIFMDKWVEHATTQHGGGNSRHHEVLGLGLWIHAKNKTYGGSRWVYKPSLAPSDSHGEGKYNRGGLDG